MNKWIAKILQEREKQITKNGYMPEHDDEHTDGSIADAAAHYASHTKSELYPWDKQYNSKEKHSRIEQLVIAGALIVAELERLERANINVDFSQHKSSFGKTADGMIQA
ncbi:MAG: hypothetical protein PHO62_07550 [Sulfurimonas sp.]|uniref:hypothetical protein n=1 Tax=Sulfurimonas sp. TaxID=2022749 RepID=UPI00262CC636|nr:hypothetical protein [Sulfurimonas sp.]MDD5373260.1 hypothetical protein [Sulfurimonas sp.]